jgi:hypothetical protein
MRRDIANRGTTTPLPKFNSSEYFCVLNTKEMQEHCITLQSAWNHGRINSPTFYTSPLFTELFKWNTTTAEPNETLRTTVYKYKYSLCGRNKDQKSNRLKNNITSPPYFDVSLLGPHLSTILSADYVHTSTIPRIIFTTYIPTITELSLLRSHRWNFNEDRQTSACGATSGVYVVTSNRHGSLALFSTT